MKTNNHISITKVVGGRGWWLSIEGFFLHVPVTSQELLALGRVIEDMEEGLREDARSEAN